MRASLLALPLLPLALLVAPDAHADDGHGWPTGHTFQGERGGERLRKAPRRYGTVRVVVRNATGHFYFSPTGSHLVALTRDRGVVEVRPDGTSMRVLEPTHSFGAFVFTPDGERVVTSANGRTTVHTLGGGPHTQFLWSAQSMTPSPDSRWIATSGMAAISLHRLDGGKGKRLSGARGTQPQFADDMSRVLFYDHRHYQLEDLRTGEVKDVTARFGGGHDARLTRHGIVYWGKSGIHLGPADGADTVERITPEGFEYYWPPRLAANKNVVVTQGDGGRALYVADLRRRTFSRVSPAPMPGEKVWNFYGSTERRLFYALYKEAPEGERTKVPGRSFEARVADLETGEDRALFRAYGVYTLLMSPTDDGKRVVISIHTSNDEMTFFDLDLGTGRITRVTPDYPGWGNHYVAGDSRHFVFGTTTQRDHPRLHTLHTVELPPLE